METYITICKIYSPWEFAVWLRKLKQGLGINLEGWDGAGDGREVQKGGDICLPLADSRWGLTENSKILWSNYPSIKNKLIKKDISSLKIKNCFFEEYLGMRFFFFFLNFTILYWFCHISTWIRHRYTSDLKDLVSFFAKW